MATEPGEAFRELDRVRRVDRSRPRLTDVSGGGERLDQLGTVAPDVVDEALDRRRPRARRPRSGTSRPSSSPGSAAIGSSQRSQASVVDDDRHPVVEVGQRLVGRGRDDREGPPDRLGRRVAPARPQAGEGERRAVAADDPVRLADRALALPLVERIDRHEAALADERVAEGRARGDRLGPRVEHPRADLGLLRPVRDQAPAVGGDRAAVVALDDDGRLVGRGDVVALARIVDERLGPEDLGELGGRTLLGEPSAHAGKSSIVRTMDDAPPPPAPLDPGAERSTDSRCGAGDARARRGAARVGRFRRRRHALLPRRSGSTTRSITAAALLGLGEAALPARRRGRGGPELEGRPRAARDAIDLRRLAEHRRGPRPRRRPQRSDHGLPRGRSSRARRRTRPRSPTGSAG